MRTKSLFLIKISFALLFLLQNIAFAESPLWLEHVKKHATSEYEQGCHPKKYSAKAPLKGMVVLLHGHSSCPQQYDVLGPKLAQEGFDVYAPLLPGPGLNRLASGDDNLSELPDINSWKNYVDFAQFIAEMSDQIQAPIKVIGGVSLGGAITSYITSTHPGLFNRQMVVTPLYRFLSPGADLADILASLPLVRDQETGWGESCLRERSLGRAGLCQFKIRHAAGAQRAGTYFYEHLQPNSLLQTQWVAVENDPYVSNLPIENAMKRFDQNSNSSSCYFREGTNHSPFSHYDTPWEIKFWQDSIEKMALQFIVHGVPFFTEGPSPESSFERCKTFP